MNLRNKRRIARYKKKKIAALFVAVSVVILIVMIDLRLKPIARTHAEVIVNRLCYESINSAADEAVENSGITYNDIVHIQHSSDNSVTAVMADISTVNKIKTGVSEALTNALKNIETQQIKVPTGTISGVAMFAGKGPCITVKVQLTGSSEVEISSQFESVGINQTRHTVVMNVRCIVYVVMLGRETMSEITLSVPIAETIIIGAVPDTYLSLP